MFCVFSGATKKQDTEAAVLDALEVQLKVSDRYDSYVEAARYTVEAYNTIANTLQVYNFSNDANPFRHLHGLLYYLKADEEKFDPAKREHLLGELHCNRRLLDLSTDIDLLKYFVNISNTAEEAMRTSPTGCMDAESEWIKELKDCKEKFAYGTFNVQDELEECREDSLRVEPSCMETHLECGCMFAGYYYNREEYTEDDIENALALYQSMLFEFTGTSDLNHTRVRNQQQHWDCLHWISDLAPFGVLIDEVADLSAVLSVDEPSSSDFVNFVLDTYGEFEKYTPQISMLKSRVCYSL